MIVKDKICKIQVWDTAGQERYRSITNAYYRGADAIFIIFDVTSKESFTHIDDWIEEIMKYVEKQINKQRKFNLVLTHTCPINTEPRHMFLTGIDQTKVDKTTELFLQRVANWIDFDAWYFGHFHGHWDNGKYHMLFEDYVEVR